MLKQIQVKRMEFAFNTDTWCNTGVPALVYRVLVTFIWVLSTGLSLCLWQRQHLELLMAWHLAVEGKSHNR